MEVLFGFFLFCIASSSVYIFNDIRDQQSDRQHPRKKYRPISSGKISIPLAMNISITLGIISLVVSFYARATFGWIILVYIALNVLYSLILKQVVILDVMTIAAGFILRVIGGAEIVEIYPSNWLIICTILLSLFIGFSKRRHELVILSANANNHRTVLRDYSSYFIDQMIGVVTAATVMSYMLYTVSNETVNFWGTRHLIWTIPFVLYGIFRYLYLIHQKNEGGDPAELVLKDIPILLNVLLWAIS